MGFPGTEWGEPPADPLSAAPLERNWEKIDGHVRHIFTHFDLRLDVYAAEISPRPDMDGVWAELSKIETYALPTVMKKVLKLST